MGLKSSKLVNHSSSCSSADCSLLPLPLLRPMMLPSSRELAPPNRPLSVADMPLAATLWQRLGASDCGLLLEAAAA
jgi:hypothetical protein